MPVRLAGVASLIAVLACGEEGPTSVGGSLLPGQSIRTIEVVLDPARFLVRDTAFSGYTDPKIATYFILARDFQGTLQANTLARFDLPRSITVTDSAGTLRSDSVPRFFAGRIVVQLDTLRSTKGRPLVARAYRIEEPWDPASASWTYRTDTTGVRERWTRPGATGGRAIGEAMLGPETDSLVIPVDSATLAAWADTTTLARGAVLVLETMDARVRASDVVLRADARSSIRADTVVTLTLRPLPGRFVFTPDPPAAGPSPLAGGNPAWRTYLEFSEGLDTLTVACPTISPGCRVRIRDASVTYGALLFVPAVSPAGYVPEDSMPLTARTLIAAPTIPLARSPVADILGIARRPIRPSQFLPPAGGTPVELPVTDFVRALAQDSARVEPRPPRWIAVLPLIEGQDFGVAAFAPGPRLRLILTIGSELQLR